MSNQLFAPMLFLACILVLASGHRQVDVHRSIHTGQNRESAGDAPPVERFIEALKLGFRAANSELPSKDRKRVSGKDPNGNSITIKQWAGTNKVLKQVRDTVIPPDYAEVLVDNVFADTLRRKFGDSGKTGASRSGSKIFAFDYDNKTKNAFLLKSEDRDEVYKGLVPVQGEYAKAIESMDGCHASVMMKVLLVFEPLDVDPSVNKKVWTLLTNVNPFPNRVGNAVTQYDLKHSREKNRCHAPADVGVGYLGDFLRDFGVPLRDAIQAQEPWLEPPEDDAIYKNTCMMDAILRDLAALDSGYPEVKLVDQSLLIFVVRPKDDKPTLGEKEIANRHNNVITVRKGGEFYFLVFGLIDLFAAKKAGKKFQAYTTRDSQFLFNQGKFSLYPFNLFCLSQFFLGYTDFRQDGTVVRWGRPGQIGCFSEELVVTPHNYTLSQLSSKDATRNVHELFKHTDFLKCSIHVTCDNVLRDDIVRENLHDCCKGDAPDSTQSPESAFAQCPL